MGSIPSKGRQRITKAMLGLTEKESRFVQGYVSNSDKSNTQIAIESGYSSHTAHVIASENLNKPKIQNAIIAILEQQGCTDTHLSKRIYESTNANKVVSSYTEGDSIQPDHAIRLKGVELALRIKGLLSTSTDSMMPTVTINSDKLMILLQSSQTPSTTVPAITTPTGEEKQK